MSKLKPEKDGEEGGVFVVMPDDDLTDVTAADEPIVLVVTGEDETTTQPKIAVPPFGPFRKGINLLSKEQQIEALLEKWLDEQPQIELTLTLSREPQGESTHGLEHLIDGGINEL